MTVLMRAFCVTALCVILSALAGGCGCTSEIKARDIRVTLDEELKGQPVELNFYAVNSASERETWTGVAVDEYFRDRSPLRMGSPGRGVLRFPAGGQETSLVFGAGQAEWAKWKERGAGELIVLAFISQSTWAGSPQSDPRRMVLPLDKCRWDKPNEAIQISVHPSSITVETPPSAEKK